MPRTRQATEKNIAAKDRVFVALDVPTADEARRIADELRGTVGGFKIGLQLFTAAGPDIVREFVNAGDRIFLDLKFHDIPNTVAMAAAEAAKIGVWMFNVHAAGGREMMRRAADAVNEVCGTRSLAKPKLIAVTVLTSSNAATLKEQGISDTPEKLVLRYAKLAADCGLDGVVASALEAKAIRNAIDNNDLLIVTPGIRPKNATADDQKRVTTPAEAFRAGSDILVIGRPITAAAARAEAARAMIAEIGTFLDEPEN
jgi:orotidine-5'-phosphate decarboxylase